MIAANLKNVIKISMLKNYDSNFGKYQTPIEDQCQISILILKASEFQ